MRVVVGRCSPGTGRQAVRLRQDLGADKAGHCLAKGQVVALGEVDPIHPGRNIRCNSQPGGAYRYSRKKT